MHAKKLIVFHQCGFFIEENFQPLAPNILHYWHEIWMVISYYNIVNVKQAYEKCIRLSGNLLYQQNYIRKAKHKLYTFWFWNDKQPNFLWDVRQYSGPGKEGGEKIGKLRRV